MKKHLLFASMALLGTSSVFADQLPDPGDREKVTYSTNLSLVWYAAPTGTAATPGSARSGIGVNGKFYVALQNNGVAIFDKDGMVKTIPNKDTWVSINVDDAGHVYFRNDIGGWAGPEGAGWYLSENARFCVIDSKTDNVIAADIPMAGASKCRFDALPHIFGNMMEGLAEIPVTANALSNNGYDFFYNDLVQTDNPCYMFDIQTVFKDGGFPAPANVVQTLGSCQMFEPDEDGMCQKMAVLPNNQVEVTASKFGWGNNIALFERNMEDFSFEFTGKWLNTPSHTAIGGFCVFSYAGKNYICYPAGTTADNYASGDGFFVMPEQLVDTPKNMKPGDPDSDWYAQLKEAVAYKYATDGISGTINYRGINVEPVEGQDGIFTIYHYNPGFSMEVWTLDLTEFSGLKDIVAEKDAAKIFGGIGVVVVDGAEKAQVYTTAGQLVAEGAGRIAVEAGLYIVKAGDTVAKVIVK